MSDVSLSCTHNCLQTLFEDLPEDMVKFGHRLSRLQLPDSSQPGSKAFLEFENSTDETGSQGKAAAKASYEAKLVLGCDGLLSAVRQVWLPGSAEPQFQGNIMMRGLISTQTLGQQPAWKELFKAGGVSRRYVLGGGLTGMVYPMDGRTTVWVVNAPYDTAQVRRCSGLQQVVGRGYSKLPRLDNSTSSTTYVVRPPSPSPLPLKHRHSGLQLSLYSLLVLFTPPCDSSRGAGAGSELRATWYEAAAGGQQPGQLQPKQ